MGWAGAGGFYPPPPPCPPSAPAPPCCTWNPRLGFSCRQAFFLLLVSSTSASPVCWPPNRDSSLVAGALIACLRVRFARGGGHKSAAGRQRGCGVVCAGACLLLRGWRIAGPLGLLRLTMCFCEAARVQSATRIISIFPRTCACRCSSSSSSW